LNTVVPTRGIASVVVAAGSSSRMGRNKLLLELEGEALVRRTVGRALAAGLDPVHVVLGFEAERVSAALAGLPHRAVLNPDPTRGVGSSMRVGMGSVPQDASAAVILLGDMPLVTEAMLRTLVDVHRRQGAVVVASRYGEVTAPPNLFGASLFPEFAALEDGACARQILRRHAHEAVFCDWPLSALVDVDRPEDFERLAAQLAAE
jgi:molybdenum cofactor cytidylyltransferase